MSGLILPGDVPARGGLTIHVPRGYETPAERMEDEGGHICRVVVDAASEEICGTVFAADRERDYLRHLRKCVSDHRDEIRAASPRTRMPILDPNQWDVEIDAHMREVGQRMIREGRLEVKPSERAGF